MNRPDPVLLSRVKQYLEENVHQTYLDVGLMTKDLQDRYQEYNRRKFVPFRMMVEQAYTMISKSILKEGCPESDESYGSDLEMMDDSAGNNQLNNMLTTLYTKSKGTARKNSNELIDISSDEDGDDKCTNGKSRKDTPLGVKQFREVTLTKVGNEHSTPKVDHTPLGAHKRDHAIVTLENANKKRRMSRSQSPKGKHSAKEKAALDVNLQHQQANQYKQQHIQRLAQMNQYPNNNSNDGSQYPLNQIRPRKYKKEVLPKKCAQSFQDIGGMDKILKELCELLMHVKNPDIYFVLGLMPPRGILLHGPPGCGKSLLARAIAGQLGIGLIEVAATEFIAGVSGESEERIRDVFEQATLCSPCVLFIDEIDAISSNRLNAQKDMERRIVSQLISSLDVLKNSENGQLVLVIGATTRPDVLDPALRRVGRFDHEIAIGIPNKRDRKEILTIICDGISLEQKFDYDKIAELTPGYVGADLLALVSRSATIAVKRKCAEQMREFQAKTRQNITIVDLIEETAVEDESTAGITKETDAMVTEEGVEVSKEKEKEDPNAKETDEENTKNVNGSAEGDAEPESMEVDETSKSTSNKNAGEKPADNKKNTRSTKKSTASIVEEKKDDKNEKEDEPSNETVNVGDKPAGGGSIDVDEVHEIDMSNIPEPTLFEMLNWLDKGLDDATIADFCITFNDFLDAVKVLQPSAKREGFITVPDVTWDDIGSLQDIREELKLAVLAPVKFPEKLAKLGLAAPSGILLCGPPGCGKTLLAKAVANEAGINFISVKGPELMNMYVGESERAVRACFQRARNSAPCVIFFDEFDSLCPKRADNTDSGSGTRVVNQLLTEMDGVEERKGVYILAASNRPDIIDPAILRPGRLDTILYVGLPQAKDREEILNAQTKNRTRPTLDNDVNFAEIAKKTDSFTGADLAGLIRQASLLALKEAISNPDADIDDSRVSKRHFEAALKLVRPSVSLADRKVYDALRLKYAAPRLTSPK